MPTVKNSDTFSRQTLRSVFPTSHLPAVPEPRGALLLSVLYQLDQSQWWTAEKLQNEQFAQLNSLVAHAAKQAPWYRERLRAAGVTKGRDITAETWLQLPILERATLQKCGTALHAKTAPEGHRKLVQVSTSGSTGTPVTVVSTEVSRLMWQVFTMRDHYWHGTDFSGTLAAIRIFGDKNNASYPQGHSGADWGPPVNLLHETGPSAALDIHTDAHKQLEWLQRQDPHRLLTFPTNAAELARLSLANGIVLPRLATVRLLSEVVDDTVRTLIRDAWNASVTQGYSAQEVGHIALQCPQSAHMHIQAENLYVEIVDEEGHPCALGEVGRVLVTTLQNYAMPLIRYAIGDYAEAGAPCVCGRGLPVIRRVLGRVRNMLATPNGDRHWPKLAAPFYRDIAPVIQHQLVQHSVHSVEARLVVERALTEVEEDQLREKILERLGYPFELSFSYPKQLERSASGKFEEFLCLVG